MVVHKGKVVQQGTHSALLEVKGGAYWNLVHSQQLATISTSTVRLAEDGFQGQFSRRQSAIVVKESYETLVDSETTAVKSVTTLESPHSPNVLGSFWVLLMEQKKNWTGYLVMIVAAMGAAGEWHIVTMQVLIRIANPKPSEQPITSIPFRANYLFFCVLGRVASRIN